MTNSEVPGARIQFGLPSKDRAGPPAFGPAGTVAGMLVVVLVVGGLFWSAASGRPASADRPQLFAGSLVLGDTRPLTVIDLATAAVTVRLEGVNAQVGAAADGDVQPVPVQGGTVLVNRGSGSFNFLDADNYVADPAGPGVGLGPLQGTTGATGYASGADAYIVRTAPASTVSLVGRQTVAQAARAQAGSGGSLRAAAPAVVPPLGFSALAGQVSSGPGEVAVDGADLWALVAQGGDCRVLQLTPAPMTRPGLTSTPHGTTPSCNRAALEAGSGSVGLAAPGRVVVFRKGRPALTVPAPFTRGAIRILPVTGATGRLWYMAEGSDGWELFGVGPGSRTVGPFPLAGLGPSADPVTPVLAAGFLYTLDQTEAGQPTLWTIDVTDGRMAPLRGVSRYPVLTSAERPTFQGAQVILDGPRVIFNNPQSLEAVVVFTDSGRLPAVVDKSQAVAISPTGPADLTAPTATSLPGSKGRAGGPAGTIPRSPVPVVQPVSKQVTCAQTTQKPYAPQITGVTPSSEAALIQWSYALLDQTDCEPDTWLVQVRALTGSHQPGQPRQVVSGQDQYLFQGLRPATAYQVVVTAFINRQSTSSTPATFTTPARGPDAPLSVQTRADGNGDWIVSWAPCTEAARPDCVVPADEWTVVGSACGGSFIGSPPTVQVPGTQSSVTISAGDLKLLGDSLSFSVQGSLSSGLAGNPTSDRACTEAYQKPDASAIAVKGQGVEDATSGTITATVTVEATGDPGTVFGVPAADAQFVYTLVSSAGTRTFGPTGQTATTIAGLPAGVAFTPSVTVYPDGHPDAEVTITGNPFQQTLSWPDVSQLEVTATVDQRTYDAGTVTVALPPDTPGGPLSAVAPPSAGAPGAGPQLQCGGAGGAVQAYPVQPIGPSRQLTFPMSDLVDMGGSCTISFSLSDGADPDPYGGPSSQLTAAFTIGKQPSYDFSFAYVNCGDFQCGPLGKPYTVEIHAADPFAGGGDWSVTIRNPKLPQPADPCYVVQTDATMPDGLDLQLPTQCLDVNRLVVTVQWKYLGQEESATAVGSNSPGPPATTTTTTSPACTTSTTSTAGAGSTSSTSGPPDGCVPSTSTSGSAGRASGAAARFGGVAAGTGIPAGAVALAWSVGAARRRPRKEDR